MNKKETRCCSHLRLKWDHIIGFDKERNEIVHLYRCFGCDDVFKLFEYHPLGEKSK